MTIAEELHTPRRGKKRAAKLTAEAGIGQRSVQSWLLEVAERLNDWSGGSHPLAKALWTADVLIHIYAQDEDALESMAVWHSMPKLRRDADSKCLREISIVLDYLIDEDVGCYDPEAIAASMLLSALANAWDSLEPGNGPPRFVD